MLAGTIAAIASTGLTLACQPDGYWLKSGGSTTTPQETSQPEPGGGGIYSRNAPTPSDKEGEQTPSANSAPRIEHPGPYIVDWGYQLTVPLRNDQGEYNFSSRAPSHPERVIPPFQFDGPSAYTPMPQPGGQHGPGFRGWMSWVVNESMRRVAETEAPVGLLLRNRNAPYPYYTEGHAVEPTALRDALDALPRLDYLFMDLEFEPENIERNARLAVEMVRNHPNPAIRDAVIGNYQDFPGEQDAAMPWEHSRSRRNSPGNWDRLTFYAESGMNVAMPAAYPYESYSVHAHAPYQTRSGACPNDRAALLWAPLERVGTAAASLPEGHLLVPWVSNFVNYIQPDPQGYYDAAPPPRDDLVAMIVHLRLRGSNGYVVWTRDTGQTDHPTIGYDEYRELTLETWKSLDPMIPMDRRWAVLNTSDPKTTGVMWSGLQTDENVLVFVSNLSGSGQAKSVRLPAIPGIPSRTEAVPDGGHQLFIYAISDDEASLPESNK